MRRRPFPSPLMIWLKRRRRTPADTTAPTLTSATTDATGLSTALVFDESVTGLLAADFALSTGQAISDVSGSGDTWTLTHAQVYQGQTPTLAYSGTAVEDAAGNALAAFSGAAVTNGSTVPQPATLPVGLISFWELEEASGTRNDSHGTNHLTDVNTVTSAAGKVGDAAQFTRANTEYLEINDNSSLSMGAGQSFTVALWVRFDTLPGSNDNYFLSKMDASNKPEYLLGAVNVSGGVIFRVNNGATSYTASKTVAWATDTWYFIVGECEAGVGVRVYVDNGAAAQALNAATYAQDGGNTLRLGARQNVSFPQPLDGRLDQVGIWKRLLTAAEKTYLYNSGSGRTYAEVLAASP